MNRRHLTLLVCGLLLVGLCAAMLQYVSSNRKVGRPGLKALPIPGLAKMEIPLPERVLNYTSVVIPPDRVTTNTLPRDTSLSQRRYTAPEGGAIWLNVVMMHTDRTSIHKAEFCLLGQGWRIDQSTAEQVRIPRPYPFDLPVTKLVLSSEIEHEGQKVPARMVYVYWFVADQALTSNHRERVWMMSKELLTHGLLQRWAYVSCYTICAPGQEAEAFERIRQFLAASVPEFQVTTGPALAANAPTAR